MELLDKQKCIQLIKRWQKDNIVFPLRKVPGGYAHICDGHGDSTEPDLLDDDIGIYLKFGLLEEKERAGEPVIVINKLFLSSE